MLDVRRWRLSPYITGKCRITYPYVVKDGIPTRMDCYVNTEPLGELQVIEDNNLTLVRLG